MSTNTTAKLVVGIVVMFFALALFRSLFTWVTVEGDEVLVVQHWKKGVLPEPLYSGTHFMFPAFAYTGLYKYNIGTQKITFDDRKSNDDAEYPRISVEVGENGGQHAEIAMSVNYHLNPEKVVTLHKQGIGKTYESVVLKREIVDVVNEISRPAASVLDIFSGKGFVEFKDEVEKELKTNTVLKDRGIEIENTIIYGVHLDPKYESEIALKQLAIQEYLTKIEQTKAQEQEAKRIFAESQANVEKARQVAEGNKITQIKQAEAKAEQEVLEAQATKKKLIALAEGDRDANLAKASGILAVGEAEAKVEALKRESLYAGESGQRRRDVEIAQARAAVVKDLLRGVSVVPEKTVLNMSNELLKPVISIDEEKNDKAAA